MMHDFSKCILCQEIKPKDKLVDPNNKKQNNGQSGYDVIESVLLNSKNSLTPILKLLAAIVPLHSYLLENHAKYHKTCYNDLKRKQNHQPSSSSAVSVSDIASKYEAPKKRQSSIQICCFICNEPNEAHHMHKVLTQELNQKIKEVAEYLKLPDLLSKVSSGDLIAKDALYHLHCLTKIYRDYDRQKKIDESSVNDKSEDDLVFAKICVHLLTFSDVKGWSISMADVRKLCNEIARDEKYKLPPTHSTRLKEKLLKHIPSLIETKSGRNVVLSFKAKTAFSKIDENKRQILENAAKILRQHLFHATDSENVLDDVDQISSFATELLYFIKLLLDGDDDTTNLPQPVLTICQLIKFNAVKSRSRKSLHCSHNAKQETPLPIYIGTLMHSMRKSDLIGKLHKLGLSISYDRVCQLTANICNSICDTYDAIDREFHVIEKFFVMLYDHSSLLKNVNDAQRALYKNSLSLELIPPTQAALYQHVKRTVLQGSYIWGKCMEKMLDAPNPTDYGWTLVEYEFQPLWTTLPEKSSTINTTRCGCKVSCKRRCKCKGNCTLLCKCEGRCYSN